ncbi:MAG: cell wall hydrolase [Methyloceanibacter sp.]|uniref:cell wall hydrolase n=1 Tax=Methyloceanibacter sp. TaxID=1965321 RepID=UPI003D6CF0B5
MVASESTAPVGAATERPRAPSTAAASTLRGIEAAALEVAAESTVPAAAATPSDSELACLAEGIYFEARGESVRGQLAVGRVILNRVESGAYPDTICGVVYQNDHRRNRCQFSFACDGTTDAITEYAVWEDIQGYAAWLLAGETKPRPLFQVASLETSTHYHADYVKPDWAKRMTQTGRIGRHYFYFDPRAYAVESAWLLPGPRS